MPTDHSEFQQLQDLLVAPGALALQEVEKEVENLRQQMHDPGRQKELLAAVVPEIFRSGDPALAQAVVDAIVPLLDQAIRQRSEQDPAAMAGALAPASTGAIARYYASSPRAAAQDLGPLVSASIRSEIRSERDAVIDALYPVIGGTIAKYLSHTLSALVHAAPRTDRRRSPVGFSLALGLVLLLLVPLSIYLSRDARDRDVASSAAAALAHAVPSPLKGVSVEAERGTLRLSGIVPNAYQRARAEAVVAASAPGWSVENGTEVAGEPLLPVLGTFGVRQAVDALNTLDGVVLGARYGDGDLAVSGVVPDSLMLMKVCRVFGELPGVRSLTCAVAVGDPLGLVHVYFERNSMHLNPGDVRSLEPVRNALVHDMAGAVRVIGYSDRAEEFVVNPRVALGRAVAVRDELVRQGVPPDRLQAEGALDPPPGTAVYPDSLSRCVQFIRIPGTSGGTP